MGTLYFARGSSPKRDSYLDVNLSNPPILSLPLDLPISLEGQREMIRGALAEIAGNEDIMELLEVDSYSVIGDSVFINHITNLF